MNMGLSMSYKIENNELEEVMYSFENEKRYIMKYYKVPEFLKSFYVSCLKDIIVKRGSEQARLFNSHIVRFWDFCKLQNIDSFEKFNPQITNYFIAYLNTSLTKDKNKNPLSQSTKRVTYSSVYLFFSHSLFFYEDDFKSLNYFRGEPFETGEILTESIPEPVLKEIKANLFKYHDIYVSTYILLALNYGMRFSEIINLKEDCLIYNELGKNKYDLHFYSGKINRHRTLYSINNTIAKKIKELIEYSKELRVKHGRKEIFIDVNKLNDSKYTVFDNVKMNRLLNLYMKDNNIKHPSGDDMHLTTHMFRRTLPEMFSKKGVDIFIAQEVLGHKSIATTKKYYDRTNEYEYEKSMQEALGKITVFGSIEEINISAIKSNPLRYKVIEEGYCANEECVNGSKLCPQLQSRGNCYGCSSMITTPEYLPFFYRQLENEQKHLDDVQSFGVDVARHYEWKIGIIKEIITKLERLAS